MTDTTASARTEGRAGEVPGAEVDIRVLTDRTTIAEEWERLAEQVGASPFVSYWFIDAWHRAFGSAPLRIMTARRSGELVGVMPWQSRLGRVSSPTNYESPEFGILATDAAVARRLWDELLTRGPRSVDLAAVVVGSETEEVTRAVAARHDYDLHQFTQVRSPRLDLTVGWERFEHERVSKNRRQNLRRKRRRLEEQGTVTVELVDGSGDADLDPVLADVVRLEASGWKGENGTAMASDPRMSRFYLDVAHRAARRGMLRLMCLRLDGRLLAFDYSLRSKSTLYNLKVSYDEEFAKQSPGNLLTYEVFKDAFTTGCDAYELTGRNDWHKRQWTDLTTDKARLLLLAPTVEGRLASVAIGQADRVPEAVLNTSKSIARRVLRV